MASASFRGVVQGGVVVLRNAGDDLADRTEVVVTPLPGETGSPVAVLAAVNNPPHVPPEWVDELDDRIALGRRPPAKPNPFPDDQEN
jgi:hypothetical protein